MAEVVSVGSKSSGHDPEQVCVRKTNESKPIDDASLRNLASPKPEAFSKIKVLNAKDPVTALLKVMKYVLSRLVPVGVSTAKVLAVALHRIAFKPFNPVTNARLLSLVPETIPLALADCGPVIGGVDLGSGGESGDVSRARPASILARGVDRVGSAAGGHCPALSAGQCRRVRRDGRVGVESFWR